MKNGVKNLPSYSYTIQTDMGETKKGSIEAESRLIAMEELKADGSTIVEINENILGGGSADSAGMLAKKPKVKDLAVFCRQFVSIERAGVPVVSCLGMLAEQTNNEMLRGAIHDCKGLIGQGDTLSQAMSQYPKVFPTLLVTLVEAGEASGNMSTSFERMADQLEKDAKIQAQLKKAGVYPAVVTVVMICVVIVMLVFVVPTFEEMFADMGTELPWITVQVVNASAYLQDKWYMVMAYLGVGMFLMMKFLKSPSGESFTSYATIKLPVVRNLTTKTACARMSRTLSTLLASGLPILDAVEITANTMTNLLFKSAVEGVAEEVAVGNKMSDAIRDTGIFPPLVYHMVGIGEETGGTEEMLDTLADYYEEEVEAAVEQMMALLEPLIIIVLAVVVGGIIGSVMAPMATMYESLSNL